MLSTAVSAPQEFIPPLSLSPEAERDLRNMFQKCRTEGEISRVIEGAKSGWKGFFKPYPLNPRLCIQAHTIRGLKVYRDAQHELVADLALGQKWEETDRQGSRRVKEVCKICDGTVQHMVRYSSSYKSHGDNDPSNFSLYIKNELEVRQQLGSIAHLLPLFHGSYIGKRGDQKCRFELPVCDGKFSNIDYPIADKKTYILSLRIFLEALSALEQMHSKGFMHKDFRPGNIFFKENHGFLAGLKLATRIAGPSCCTTWCVGSYRFASAENLLDLKSDMFAVGGSLLRMYRSDLWKEFCSMQNNLWSSDPDVAREGRANWPQNIRALQQKLLDQKCPEPRALSQLISELIDADPMKRPPCTQAIGRLREIIQQLGILGE